MVNFILLAAEREVMMIMMIKVMVIVVFPKSIDVVAVALKENEGGESE